MAVYTSPDPAALAAFLADYPYGPCTGLEGIRDGIENSNFFLDTAHASHVLTIFESSPAATLPWFLELMDFLAARGIPCTHPRQRRDGGFLGDLCGKPAALFARLSGASLLQPTLPACAALGDLLARLHLAGQDFPATQANARGPDWRTRTAAGVAPQLPPAAAERLRVTLAETAGFPPPGLPSGVIHADLFRDNVLFDADQPVGVLDFYFACQGPCVYDLAIAVIDWCFMPTHSLMTPAAGALLAAYHRRRPLLEAERAVWLTALRAAALRFWLSRLKDSLAPRSGALAWQKDPAEFEGVLRSIERAAAAWLAVWPER